MSYTLNGLIYRGIIDPILSAYYANITGEINRGERVIDIASGTGSLGLAIAKKGADLTGIDLSEEMVEMAGRLAKKRGVSNAVFLLKDAGDLSSYRDNEFDVAVTSMAIHQFDSGLALSILGEMRRIASRVIIMDYNHPMQAGIAKLVIF
ncbi:MAG: class I SAM-dependent methyltransferase, partial [Bacteroidales bacterium]|nr:class I SAM-dependent methyltransferase [Bacteroidales bacterium]